MLGWPRSWWRALKGSQSNVARDVEAYAVAACFAQQDNPYFRDQSDAWASALIQRMHVKPGDWAGIAEQVNSEAGKDKALPLLYCNEIIDRLAVSNAIGNAAQAVKAD